MKRIGMTAIASVLVAYGAAAMAAESTSDLIRRDAPKGITEAFYSCIDKANYNGTAVGACLSSEQDVQDARLNRAYKALLSKLDGKGKQQLVNAERAWLAFRDKSGRLDSTLYGTEIIANLQVSQRDVFRMCERANELEDYLALVNDQ